jgi:hypothetical protein
MTNFRMALLDLLRKDEQGADPQFPATSPPGAQRDPFVLPLDHRVQRDGSAYAD